MLYSNSIPTLEVSDSDAVAANVTPSVNRGQGNQQGCAGGHDTFTQRAKEKCAVHGECKHPDKDEGLFSFQQSFTEISLEV